MLFAIDKLRKPKGVLSKLRYYAPISVLRNVNCGTAYSHLQYGITIYKNAAAKYVQKIETQQNFFVKIMSKVPILKTKVSPIYHKLNSLILKTYSN